MYRNCLVGQDLPIVIALVLALVVGGLLVAVSRQTIAARKWRGMFRDACAEKRQLRLELDWAKHGGGRDD